MNKKFPQEINSQNFDLALTSAMSRLEKIILETLNYRKVLQRVVDSILYELGYLNLGYRIIVLALIDKKQKVLKRVSISQTPEAEKAIAGLPMPYAKLDIPLSAKNNYCIKVMNEKKSLVTHDWSDILSPPLTTKEAAMLQKHVGITTSMVYPLFVQNKPIGMMIFSMVKSEQNVSEEEKILLERFTDIVGLAVQNSSLYSQIEEANLKLKAANKALRHLDKLKDEFVFIATHELKNPVTAMRGYLYMLEKGMYGTIPDKMQDALEQINSSNQQLVQLVNDLLQIARAEAKTIKIKTQPLFICETIAEVIESVTPMAKQKNIELIHKCDKKQKVLADPDRLKEILNNLISNAIKYSEKGSITVSHRPDEKREYYLITDVSDQGVGIAENDQQKIFTRFFRAEEDSMKDVPGTGLGLFIVKELVEKMNGKIWFESEKGVGSTFSFSLPKS